jgi:hypothetical protein
MSQPLLIPKVYRQYPGILKVFEGQALVLRNVGLEVHAEWPEVKRAGWPVNQSVVSRRTSNLAKV